MTSPLLITTLFNVHLIRRYSNTLLITLNNRIYFRDHPSPEIPGDNAYVGPLASGNREGQLSRFAAQIGPSESTAGDGIPIRLHTLLPPTDTEKGKSDFVSTSSITP